MKIFKIIIAFVVTFISITTLYAQGGELKYSKWLFVQSDQSLQSRIAVVKMEGNTAYLQLQYRVNNEDEIYCKSPDCNGILLVVSNTNVGDKESTKYSFVFEKSFVGLNNIYTMPQLITTELKTWPDGSKRFWTPERGIVYTKPDSDAQYFAYVPSSCADVPLISNPTYHRCKRAGFDRANAVIVR